MSLSLRRLTYTPLRVHWRIRMGVRVILAPNIDVSKTYSGTLKKKESVGAVLNLIKNAIPLEYKIVGNSVFLSSMK